MSDLISRQRSIDALRKMQTYKLFAGDDMILIDQTEAQTELMMLPSAQPEPEAISKWKKEFREYVGSLDIARDDWKGIIEYIDELPSAEPDTTTDGSNVVKKGGNDEDRTSGDCISRQQAFDALHCRFADGFEEDRWWNSTHVIAALKGLPAVPPERKTGRWIHQTKFGRIECDQCGKVFRNTFAPKNFCPNCGAKMEGGDT